MKGWDSSAIGKRKRAVARVYLKAGSGKILVNKLPFEDYFGRETLKMVLKQPLVALEKEEDFDISFFVKGGGKSSQAGACRLGLSRALQTIDPECRSVLKAEGFFTRDSREVERKKYGRHKARKKPQFSKR